MPNASRSVIVVGGGVAGLAAAAYLARAGLAVRVLERSDTVGGRAATWSSNGFYFNRGAHALYARGAARRVLAELGVRVSGHLPSQRGLVALDGGRQYLLPTTPGALLRTQLFGWLDKLELMKLLIGLPRMDAGRFNGQTAQHWLERQLRRPRVRSLVTALIRLTTYTHAPERLGADAAIRQLQLAVSGNVLYLDHGWQTVVAGLDEAAKTAGAVVETGVAVVRLEGEGTRIDGVALKDGRQLEAAAVVLAVGPTEALQLVGDRTRALSDAVSAMGDLAVRAACLDVGLSRLPDPRTLFALGIDAPVYFSVHSATAQLAPPSGALIHCARYWKPREPVDGPGARAQLERLLDLLQSGWRAHTVDSQYLPAMTVSHSLIPPGGRPVGVSAVGVEGLFLAGDWVGGEGMLADAALASAREAAAHAGNRPLIRAA